MNEIIIADVIMMKFLLQSKVLQEIIDEHLIRLKVLRSFYALEHFLEDHWIIVVEMKDKNLIPNQKDYFH
jgi:hypothetical protein